MNKYKNGIKVLILTKDPRFIGGVANFTKIYMEKWRDILKKDFEIYFFIQGRYYEKWKNYFLLLLYPLQYVIFITMISKTKPKIVHLNPSMSIIPMWRDGLYLRIAKRREIKTLFFIHGWEDSYFQNAVKQGIFSKFHQKTLKIANAIIVLSPEFKEKLISIGIKSDKIYVLSTMVDADKYRPDKKDFFPPYKLLFCARLVREKGVYEAIEGMKYITNESPNTTLTVMGGGEELENLREYARKIGVENKVIFTGYVPENKKIEIFKKAHIFIYPSYYGEGFPTVILEAMAAGLPVITTPVGGVKYALKEGLNGFFIKSIPPDPKEISKYANLLIKNPKELRKIYLNNIIEAREKYDVHAVIQKIMEFYYKMLNISDHLDQVEIDK